MTRSLQSIVCECTVLTTLSADRAVPTMIIHEFVDSISYLSTTERVHGIQVKDPAGEKIFPWFVLFMLLLLWEFVLFTVPVSGDQELDSGSVGVRLFVVRFTGRPLH